jgi:hypothetical protein
VRHIRRTAALAGLILALLPLPALADPPASVSITQTVQTLTAATDAALTGTGGGIRMLCIQNTGTGLVTLAFGGAATAGSGYALNAAAGAGQGGGAICWNSNSVPRDVVHAISAAGSVVVTLVGK